MSKCPNVRFDTEGLFSNPCSCSQQNISLEDTTKMRMGNNTGFVRMADRDITDFQIANNSARDFENIVGSSSNQFKYFPSTASPKERKTDARVFRNVGYTSPNQWKEVPQRTSGETNQSNPSEKPPKTREGFTSATVVDPQPSYSSDIFDNRYKDEPKKDSKEGYCGYHQRPSLEMSTTNICCIVAVVILVIIVLGIFVSHMCKRCCKQCQGNCCRECSIATIPDINTMIVGGNFPMA